MFALAPVEPSSAKVSALPLLVGLGIAPLLASVIGWLLATALSWQPSPAGWSLWSIVSAASACWLMGGAIGVVVFAAASGGMLVRRVPLGMVASSLVRAGIALLDAIALMLLVGLEVRTFWLTFMLGGLGCLAWETYWAMSVIRRGAIHAAEPRAAV